MTGGTPATDRNPKPHTGISRASRRAALWVLGVAGLLCWATASQAHKLGNTYLDISADKQAGNVFYGEWFLAVPDVAAVFRLGHGNTLTFEELKPHFGQIARYAYARLHIGDGRHACRVEPRGQEEANRQLGKEYVVLFFKIACPAPRVEALDIDDRLFFDRDPTHVGVLVLRDHGNTDTAFFSSSHQKIKIQLPKAGGQG